VGSAKEKSLSSALPLNEEKEEEREDKRKMERRSRNQKHKIERKGEIWR
jgi:hypothetical protein